MFGQGAGDHHSAAFLGSSRQFRANAASAVLHDAHAHALAGIFRLPEPDPVVLDSENDSIDGFFERDLQPGGPAVFDRVVGGFLNDPV